MVFQNSRFFCLNFMLHVKSHVNSLLKWPTEATKRLAWPLRDKTQMGMAQDVADDLSFFLNN